jgi:hypothetical protein
MSARPVFEKPFCPLPLSSRTYSQNIASRQVNVSRAGKHSVVSGQNPFVGQAFQPAISRLAGWKACPTTI